MLSFVPASKGLLVVFLLSALLPARAQLGQSDCSLARDEIERDRCYRSNSENAQRQSTSSQRVNSGAPSAPVSKEEHPVGSAEWLNAFDANRQKAQDAAASYNSRLYVPTTPEQLAEAETRQNRLRRGAEHASQFAAALKSTLRFSVPIPIERFEHDFGSVYTEFLQKRNFIFKSHAQRELERVFPDQSDTIFVERSYQDTFYCRDPVRSRDDMKLVGLLKTRYNDNPVLAALVQYECRGYEWYASIKLPSTLLLAEPDFERAIAEVRAQP